MTRLALCFLLGSCSTMPTHASPVLTFPFGVTHDGRAATRWVLATRSGLRAELTDFGAALVALWLPDREGRFADVVLGFDDVAGYESQDNQYFGCTTGRVANRIANALFTLGGETHVLASNDGKHHLHGGRDALDKVLWRGEIVSTTPPSIRFTHTSPHGDEGYPGRLDLAVTYTLEDDGLRIDFLAKADRDTPVSLTHHSYWNLAGAGSGPILDQVLWLAAGHYTPADAELIPTGEIVPVAGTAFDFTTPRPIGRDYDCNFALGHRPGSLDLVARLRDPRSGRALDLWTTLPGLQLYTGSFLHGQAGKSGRRYAQSCGLCLEPQHFPNAVNEPRFPSPVLRAGEAYRHTILWRRTGS
jgi:aldose 1-epimerase